MITRMSRLAWLTFACGWLLLGQPPNKSVAPVKTDTWQKSKECSAQAEKIMAERDQQSVARGSTPASTWSNHYSPKYNRCFIKAEYFLDAKSIVKGGPFGYAQLLDAFERSILAVTAYGVSSHLACRSEPNPEECEQNAALAWKIFSKIDSEDTDRATAKAFITEHMKN
jgi:hypothetical protein